MSLPKLWDIQWPVGPNTIEAINANFDFLFRRIAALSTSSATSSGGSAVVVQQGIQAIQGTPNQVYVSGTDTVVLSLPQDITTVSAVRFSSVSLVVPLSVGNGGTGLTTVSKGDLFVGIAGNYVIAFPVGADGKVLTCSSASTSGLSWENPSGGSHSILSATHDDVTTGSVVRGDLIAGLGTPSTWSRLPKGSSGSVLTMGEDEPFWTASAGGGVGTHSLLSTTHTDVTTAAVVRGDIITGQGASPTWARLAKGTQGYVLTMGADEPAWASETDPVFALTARYGFVDRTETSLSVIDNGDGTFKVRLTCVGATFRYLRNSVLCTITGNKEVTLAGTNPPDEGMHYIYIDTEDGTLVDGAAWTLLDTKVPVCGVLWASALTPKYWLSDERHTCLIDRRMHYYEHVTEGTRLISGGTVSGQTIGGTTDATNTFGISGVSMLDEDILHDLAEVTDPNAGESAYSIFYRTGASTWAWKSSIVPYDYAAAGYIKYDNAGTQTEGDATPPKYYNSYLLMTNISGDARYVLVSGRAGFASLAAAQAEDVGAFTFAGLGIAEFVIAYRFTWLTGSGYANTGKCRLAATPQVIDISNVQAVVGGASTDHNTLANLQGGDTTERYHLTQAQNGGQWDALGAGAAVEAGSKLKVAGHAYIVQYAVGNGGAAKTIDWSNGNEQTITLDADCTLTFSNGKAGGRYVLVFTQDGTGGWAISWPGSVVWSGGIEPELDADPAGISLIAFYFDGSSYIGAGANASAASQGMPEVPLAVLHGGTGLMAIDDGELLAGNDAGGITPIAAPTASGQVLTANTGISGKMEWSSSPLSRATCGVYMSSDDVANDGVEVEIEFDSESWDAFGMHDPGTNPKRVTVPTGYGGVYVVVAGVGWAGQTAVGGEYYTRLYLNGTLVREGTDAFSYLVSGQAVSGSNLTAIMQLAEGDYLELRCEMGVGQTVAVYGGPMRTYLHVAQVA